MFSHENGHVLYWRVRGQQRTGAVLTVGCALSIHIYWFTAQIPQRRSPNKALGRRAGIWNLKKACSGCPSHSHKCHSRCSPDRQPCKLQQQKNFVFSRNTKPVPKSTFSVFRPTPTNHILELYFQFRLHTMASHWHAACCPYTVQSYHVRTVQVLVLFDPTCLASPTRESGETLKNAALAVAA